MHQRLAMLHINGCRHVVVGIVCFVSSLMGSEALYEFCECSQSVHIK